MNENDKQKLNERISAYLDGESDEREYIEHLLKTNPDAARRYAEMSRLSTALKALSAPDVHPAFATRVVAHVRDVRDAERAAPAWRAALPKILGPVTAVALIAIAVWPFWPDKGITAPTEPRDPMVAHVLQLRNQPEQVLAAAFGPLLIEPIDDPAWTDSGESGLALVADPTFRADYLAAVGKVASLFGSENGDDADADVFVSLDSLSETEAEAFRTMLTDYVEGGNSLL